MPTGVVVPFYQDPFSPVLRSSPPLVISDEQRKLAKAVLDVACADSQFADKAYRAIQFIMAGSSVRFPVVTSLVPPAAEIGDPSFTLHVHGTNFKNTDVIVFAGLDEPTTFVSATELTTGVNMDVWAGPDALPVLVKSADGELSNSMTFTFTDGLTSFASTSVKSDSHAVGEKKFVPSVPTSTPGGTKK